MATGAVGAGIGTGISQLKKAAGLVGDVVKSDAGQGVITRAASSAVIGGAAGAGLNAIRGEDMWEGAKGGAILGAGGSLAKSAYTGYDNGALNGLKSKISRKSGKAQTATKAASRARRKSSMSASGGQHVMRRKAKDVQTLEKFSSNVPASAGVASGMSRKGGRQVRKRNRFGY